MDRKQEYDALMQELRQTPPALEGTLDRALDRRRARRRKLRPLRSLAAAAAVFVLLVNVSIPFAQACTHIPVLGWLAQAVCFSHSLSSAVEHDWVQKVEQTQRDNGYTLTLEDLIVDQKQIHLFYTLDWEDPACEYAMVLVDGDRLSPRPTVLSDSVEGPQDAGHIVLDYREGQVPDRLDLVLTVRPNGDGSPAARFRFQVALDPSLTAVGQVRPVEQWVELDGQQIYVDRLEIYPTHARLNLEQDPDNAEQLQTLDFYLEDENGVRYEKGSASGLASMGDTYLCESPFFRDPKHLTLHITQATWLAPEREYVALDLERGTALDALPEDMHLSVHRIGRQVGLALIAPDPPGNTETFHASYQLFGGHYRSPDGETHDLNCSSTISSGGLWWGTEDETELPEGYFATELILEDYPWDTVELALYFSRRTEFPVPVAFDLT